MLRLLFETVVLAGAGYLTGTLLHELSHVLAVIATGSNLKAVRWRQTLVEYEPTSQRADVWVKATPALLTPIVAGVALLSVVTPAGFVFAFGLLGGFLPRDISEYAALTHIFKSEAA